MPLRKGPNILIPFGLSSDRDESLPIYYPWPDDIVIILRHMQAVPEYSRLFN
jgi:hypothetical protein